MLHHLLSLVDDSVCLKKSVWKNNMPFSHEQLWLKQQCDHDIHSCCREAICADVQYRPAASPTPTSLLFLLVFFFTFHVPSSLSHRCTPLSLPPFFSLAYSPVTSAAWCPAVNHLTPSDCDVVHSHSHRKRSGTSENHRKPKQMNRSAIWEFSSVSH